MQLLPEKIEAARIARGFTKARLAREVGVHRVSIYNILANGNVRNTAGQRIAEVLNTELSDILADPHCLLQLSYSDQGYKLLEKHSVQFISKGQSERESILKAAQLELRNASRRVQYASKKPKYIWAATVMDEISGKPYHHVIVEPTVVTLWFKQWSALGTVEKCRENNPV